MKYKRKDAAFQSICSVAAARVQAAYNCVETLLPNATEQKRVRIARKILSMCDGKDRSLKMTQAQAEDWILPQLQCLSQECPLLCIASS